MSPRNETLANWHSLYTAVATVIIIIMPVVGINALLETVAKVSQYLKKTIN